MNNGVKKPISALMGAAFVASLGAVNVAVAQDSLFVSTDLERGYDVLRVAEGKCGEGKCGEGMCGASAEAPAEGDSAEDEKAAEGKCGEGKCGEGMCGAAV